MNKKIPMRKCIGCQESKAKKDLVRMVKPKDGDIFIDPTGKSNGRGAYICRSLSCLKKARKSKGLDRSFKTSISEEVYDSLEKEMMDLDS